MKKIFDNLYFRHILIILLMFLSLYLPDLFIRIFAWDNLEFHHFLKISPNLFTLSFCCLVVFILNIFSKKVKIIIYSILVLLANILLISQNIHYLIFNRFYGFCDILLVFNATEYIGSVISNLSIFILIGTILSLLISILVIYLINKTEKISTKFINMTLIILFVITRILALIFLGEDKNELTWEDNNNPKNIYNNYANYNKAIEVSGLYEYTIRSTYVYFKNSFNFDKEFIVSQLDTYFESNQVNNLENEYTNIFKNKNVFVILLESIDSWLITEEVMPTLYKLQNEGMNFTNKYTPSFGGGQTINTEFALHTGLYAVNNGKAIYNYSDNEFKFSLANVFKNNGYITTSLHGNEGDFYNRRQFHKSLGFDNTYFLEDFKGIDQNLDFLKDSDIVKNEDIFNLMINDEKFLTFLITYSAHLPYNFSNEICKDDPYNLNVSNSESLSCIRNLARETDEMIRILIEKLMLSNKLDDTVLVFVTDHYTYGYEDSGFVKKIKNNDNEYLLQNTPFIIWSNDILNKKIDLMVDTVDILPTLFNMFGFEYNPNYYVGEDIFSESRDNFVYFANDIFYDGKIFYDGNNILNNNEEYINKILIKIKNKIDINDKLIISDYFKEKK